MVVRRSGLGKGLGSLIPTEVTGGTSVLREVPLANIRPNPLQPRNHFEEEAMSSLAASIRELGVLQPALVRQVADDEYELIAGERRWRASRRAGLQTMPVLVQESSDLLSLEQALVENLHREDLNALEEAAAYQQLIDEFAYTHEQVASRVGKSRTAVTNTLRLMQLPTGVQRALAEGSISAGHARAILGTPDRTLQEELAKLVVRDGLTVRALEEAVRLASQSLEAAPEDDQTGDDISPIAPQGNSEPAEDAKSRRLPAPGVLELEELLSTHLNTRVRVEMRAKRSQIQIDFATLVDLERIYMLMVGGNQASTQ